MNNSRTNKKTLSATNPRVGPEFLTGQDLARDILEKTGIVYSQKEPPPGLNLLPGCLVPGTVTVVCALPAEDMRAYMISLILEAQDKLLNPAVFLPNYSVEEFGLKALCVRAGLPSFGVRRGYMAREHWPLLTKAAGELSEKGIFLYRRSIMYAADITRETEALHEKLKAQGGLGVVVLDSLNNVKASDWGEITIPELGAMAKKLGLSVICSFSLNKTPRMHDGYLQLGDIRLAGLDESDVAQVFYLRHSANCADSSYASRNEVELLRLSPVMGGSNVTRLIMDPETYLFKSDMP